MGSVNIILNPIGIRQISVKYLPISDNRCINWLLRHCHKNCTLSLSVKYVILSVMKYIAGNVIGFYVMIVVPKEVLRNNIQWHQLQGERIAMNFAWQDRNWYYLITALSSFDLGPFNQLTRMRNSCMSQKSGCCHACHARSRLLEVNTTFPEWFFKPWHLKDINLAMWKSFMEPSNNFGWNLKRETLWSFDDMKPVCCSSITVWSQ